MKCVAISVSPGEVVSDSVRGMHRDIRIALNTGDSR